MKGAIPFAGRRYIYFVLCNIFLRTSADSSFVYWPHLFTNKHAWNSGTCFFFMMLASPTMPRPTVQFYQAGSICKDNKMLYHSCWLTPCIVSWQPHFLNPQGLTYPISHCPSPFSPGRSLAILPRLDHRLTWSVPFPLVYLQVAMHNSLCDSELIFFNYPGTVFWHIGIETSDKFRTILFINGICTYFVTSE